jgi:hypothetical protein
VDESSLSRIGTVAGLATRPGVPAPPPVVRRRGWTTFAAACAGVFVGVLAVVTVVEMVAGRPLSDVVRGQSGSGTSVLGDVGQSTGSSSATPTSSPTAAPTSTSTTSGSTASGSVSP